ncbi:MAG: globin [Chloroflexi bacterium]|nr:globin [Chloroflexota bacterium]
MSVEASASVHDQVGGAGFFTRLVDQLYAGVATDPVLLQLYPEQPDLVPARHRLTLFLIQYWGGPGTYSDERGHPRLRMRHAPFAVRTLERDRWLLHMRAALDSVGGHLSPDLRAQLDAYFTMAADAMRNTPD